VLLCKSLDFARHDVHFQVSVEIIVSDVPGCIDNVPECFVLPSLCVNYLDIQGALTCWSPKVCTGIASLNSVTKEPARVVIIQGVSRFVGITAGGEFLGLCDQKSSYKHVSYFGRLRSYDRLKRRREGNDY
jgi:hypothetical protein